MRRDTTGPSDAPPPPAPDRRDRSRPRRRAGPCLPRRGAVSPVPGGTDNALFRLGPRAVLRLPLRECGVRQVATDRHWLPGLAPLRPPGLAVPRLRFAGAPGPGFPHPWTIQDWLEGDSAHHAPPRDDPAAGRALAGMMRALQALPGAGALPPSRSLAAQDESVRAQIAEFRPGEGDRGRLEAEWDAAMALPRHGGPSVVVHGDLHPLNLVVRGGALSGVIDWGGLSRGDPARDLMAGWTVLGVPGRTALAAALRPDPAALARGRAHALAMACMGIPFYRRGNPAFLAMIHRILAEVLAHPA
nr:phosphotransferase [Wenxinia saemankumensis]